MISPTILSNHIELHPSGNIFHPSGNEILFCENIAGEITIKSPHVTSCQAIPCHVASRQVKSSQVKSRHITSLGKAEMGTEQTVTEHIPICFNLFPPTVFSV